MSFISSVLCLVVSLSFISCASKQSANPKYEKINSRSSIKKRPYVPSDLRPIKDIPQFEESTNHMAAGYLFNLNHPTDEKLRGNFRVNFDGFLRLPYGIKIDVRGLSFSELRKKVIDKTNAFFQKGSPGVTFILLKRQYWVEVRGFVKKSGYYLVSRKESIDKIIDKAGGLSGNVRKEFFMVSVKQGDESYSISLNQYYQNNVFGKSFTWLGGDTIFINLLDEDLNSQSVPTVSIIGGVLTPGKTLYREGATLYYYLGKAGGVIPNLGYEESYVIRKVDNKVERINFDITDMTTVPAIASGDVIMLNGEKRTMWDKIFERATQIGAVLTTIALIIVAL